jgi:putative transcriptional regulator
MLWHIIFQLVYCHRMKSEAMEDISKIIRKQRDTLGLTQEQLAAKVGVTFSTVNRWENDKIIPSPLALRRIKELQKE